MNRTLIFVAASTYGKFIKKTSTPAFTYKINIS